MPYYETVFIVRQDMSSAQVESLADQYAEVLSGYDGSVVKREMWGLRTLAYRMNKNRKGHYVMMQIDTPPAGLAEIERQMRLSEDILRYMSVKIEEVPEGPSSMLQQRERGERPPREGREGRGRDRDDRDNAGDHPARGERHAEAASAAEGAE